MRATVALSTAVALAAVIPASVRALELHGNLGAGYTQVDTWTPSTERLSVPRLVLDANLDASGFVSSPRIFTWSAGGGYQRVRQSSLDRTDVTSVLGFHLHLGVLDTTSSAVALSVDAARATNDYSTTLGGTALTGTTTENVYGAALAVRPTGRPAVRLGGSYRTSSNTGFGRTETDETTKRLTAGFTHGPGPFSLSGDYELLWNDGTLAAANYDRKTLRLNGGVSLSQNAQGYLTAID